MRRGRWETVRELGRGGQGVAHLALDTDKINVEQLATDVRRTIPIINAAGTPQAQQQTALELLGIFERYLRREHATNTGALKELHPEILQDEKARRRLDTEVRLLTGLAHPSLIRILDARPEDGWFVTPYYREGTLAENLDRFAGKPAAAVEAWRSLVDAVAALHGAGIVHRDIKPENIFLLEGRLVLGDFGIAHLVDEKGRTRVSDTYEKVGTTDWMPGWAMTMRLEEVRPTFDLFSLGKVLWAMVSGRTKMRLWYWGEPEFDLERQFPNDDQMRWINRFLLCLVVEREADVVCPDATQLLQQVDSVLDIMKHSGQVMERHKLTRCILCGRGPYEEFVGDDSDPSALENLGVTYKSGRFRIYRCQSCGNLQVFRMNERPPAWGEV